MNNTKTLKEKKKIPVGFILTILGAAVIIALILKAVFPTVRVDGVSMEPTYSNGSMAIGIALPLVSEIKNGDIIVFSNEATGNKNFIKRVEGVPADTIHITNGVLYRNGEPVDEGFDPILDPKLYSYDYSISEGEYFVLGDNRNDSYDSRDIGTVKIEDIKCVIPN